MYFDQKKQKIIMHKQERKHLKVLFRARTREYLRNRDSILVAQMNSLNDLSLIVELYSLITPKYCASCFFNIGTNPSKAKCRKDGVHISLAKCTSIINEIIFDALEDCGIPAQEILKTQV